MSWCTIESDPGVFTELISEIGVKGVQVDELYGLDADSIAALKPVYGLIFLFKWQQEEPSDRRATVEAPDVFFAKQMINNACATQAIISILLNRPELELGEELTAFRSFTQELPPDLRGLAIGNSPKIQTVHNSFAAPEMFSYEAKKATKDDDVYHFIGYVPVNGKVYELDGLQEGPILLGDCDMEKWWEVAAPAIQERIARYSAKEVRFNLLAIRHKPKDLLEKALAALPAQEARIQAKLAGNDPMSDEDATPLPEGTEALQAMLDGLPHKKLELEEQLRGEQEKHEAWKAENARRKHNYIPLMFNLLKTLAKNGKLKGLLEEGVKSQQERAAAKAKEDNKK